MLNRIYIVVGLLAIVVLAGAFIAPRFIQWSDYRDRMEELATSVLGAEVTIRGDIEFSLLPTPRLEFTDVVVGDIESPAATVQAVEAEFALVDFLRDNYNVTALTLTQPAVELVLDENGFFSSGVDIAGNAAGVALGQARISNGSVRLTDLRADTVLSASRIDGDLRLASFSGPFQFQGFADYESLRYDFRLNTGQADAEGMTEFSAALREIGNGFTLSAEGMLTAGVAPRFDGTLTWRQAPPSAEEADDIRGDLVLEGPIAASTDRAVMSGFTLVPDENRAGTRLTGAASMQFGARNSFDAVVSGGVFSLPPRDATEVAAEQPFDFVRLLSEIPAPPVPPMPGRLGIDLAEASLRGFTLRELRVDATTDGAAWTVEQAVANLPGETEVRLAGTISDDNGRLGFAGDLAVTAQRLDALAALWRRQGEDNPLFNLPGTLEARVMLAGDALGLSAGQFTFSGQTHAVEARIGFGAEPRFDGVVQVGTLSAAQTTALQALLPDAQDPSFAVSFPNGSLAVSAAEIDVLGLPATELSAEAQWAPGDLRFSRLAASDWGGLTLDAAMRLAGTMVAPRVTGSGEVSVSAGDAPALELLQELAGVPYAWQQGLALVWPADLQFILTDGEAEAQILTLAGALAGGQFDFRAEMAEGLAGLSGNAALRLVASLEATDAPGAQQRLGLGETPIFAGEQPLVGSVFLEGSGLSGLEGRVGLSQGSQLLSYFGRLVAASDGQLSGEGTIEAVLEPGSGLAVLAGVGGASFGALEASAALRFVGSDTVTLDGISAVVGDSGVRGALDLRRSGDVPTVSGALEADALDAGGLAAALFGTEALLGVASDTGPWPEGPLATDTQTRASRGDVSLSAAKVTANGHDILGPTELTYAWDDETITLRNLEAEADGGSLSLNLDVCCAGPLSDRTLSGRLAVSAVDLDALVPSPIGDGLSGVVEGGVQFEGTGQSLADVMRAMTGEGNFAIADFEAEGLSPDVFPSVASIEDALDTDAGTLETLASLGLSQGPFFAHVAQGAFSIAGGTARLANLIVDGNGGRLAGSLNVILGRLGLDGSFVLTPGEGLDPEGLVVAETARIVTGVAGTVPAPEITVDLEELVASIQVRANELEVDRLETLRLADEERQRAAAEERNRLVEEQLRQRAEEEAARLAAEEAARLEAEQSAVPQTPLPPTRQNSFEMLPPPVNQPFQLSPN